MQTLLKITIFFSFILFLSCQKQDSQQDLNWYEKSFYLLHFDHHTNNDQPVGRDADYDEILRLLKLSRPDVIQIHAKGRPGYTTYPSEAGNVPDSLYTDVLGLWKDLAKELNIPFSVYYNLGRDGYIMQHKPEFNRQGPDGTLYNDALCYNSGVDTAYLFPMIKEIMEWYQPDGFWFDGYIFTVRSCYCEKCRNDFKKAYGREAPEEPGSPDWDLYKEMQREYARSLIRRTCDFVHNIDPECLVSVNWAYGLRQPEKPYDGIAYFEGDIGGNITKLSVQSRFYDTQGKPFDLMTPIGQRGGKKEDHQKQEIAVIIANGGKWFAWDSPSIGTSINAEHQRFLQNIAGWMRERQEFTILSERLPDVSVLNIADAHYHNFRNSHQCFRKQNKAIYSTSYMLKKNHILHDIIADWRLIEGPVKGKTIVLENASVVPEETDAALIKFAENGGRIFLTGMTPFNGSEKIMQMAGVTETSGSMNQEVAFGETGIHVDCYAVQTDPNAEILLSGKNATGESIPLLIHSDYGQGEVFYAPFPFYTNTAVHLDTLPNELFDAIHTHVFPSEVVSLTTNAPSDVEITLREKDALKVIHLVNKAIGEESNANPPKSLIHGHRYAYSNTNFPARGNFRITLKQPAKPLSVVAEPGKKSVQWEYKNGAVVVDVPEFDVHQMIVLDSGE